LDRGGLHPPGRTGRLIAPAAKTTRVLRFTGNTLGVSLYRQRFVRSSFHIAASVLCRYFISLRRYTITITAKHTTIGRSSRIARLMRPSAF